MNVLKGQTLQQRALRVQHLHIHLDILLLRRAQEDISVKPGISIAHLDCRSHHAHVSRQTCRRIPFVAALTRNAELHILHHVRRGTSIFNGKLSHRTFHVAIKSIVSFLYLYLLADSRHVCHLVGEDNLRHRINLHIGILAGYSYHIIFTHRNLHTDMTEVVCHFSLHLSENDSFARAIGRDQRNIQVSKRAVLQSSTRTAFVCSSLCLRIFQ